MRHEQNSPQGGSVVPRPTQADYEALAEFRYLIRRFLAFSQEAARAAGLTPRQHQALLAIKGFPAGRPVAVGDLAEQLNIRHHSAVELVDRLAEAGLVRRMQDAGDQRRVLLSLTARAEEDLAGLSAAHLDELSRIEPVLGRILRRRRAGNTAAESRPYEGSAVTSR
jgi:DNA-binding MarR family transcriptional regulator